MSPGSIPGGYGEWRGLRFTRLLRLAQSLPLLNFSAVGRRKTRSDDSFQGLLPYRNAAIRGVTRSDATHGESFAGFEALRCAQRGDVPSKGVFVL